MGLFAKRSLIHGVCVKPQLSGQRGCFKQLMKSKYRDLPLQRNQQFCYRQRNPTFFNKDFPAHLKAVLPEYDFFFGETKIAPSTGAVLKLKPR